MAERSDAAIDIEWSTANSEVIFVRLKAAFISRDALDLERAGRNLG